jgi:hypothetical protein
MPCAVAASVAAVHAVIADFPARERAAHALTELSRAGFRPEGISILSGDPEEARDLGGRSYVRLGVLAGVLAGIAFTVSVVLMGGSAMPVNSVGFVIGALGVIGSLGFIGLVFGRSIVVRSPDAPVFARAVERGDFLLAVRCDGDRCVHARAVLVAAGAADVREEASAGPT